MKKLLLAAAVLMQLAVTSCEKMQYGDVTISSDDLHGFYALQSPAVTYRLESDGTLSECGKSEDNPGWPGSLDLYYEFGDRLLVQYSVYSYKSEKVYVLRQEDSAASSNRFSYDAGSRSVDTNLSGFGTGELILYSAVPDKLEILCDAGRREDDGTVLYRLYVMKPVTDQSEITMLQSNIPDTEENRTRILDEFMSM